MHLFIFTTLTLSILASASSRGKGKLKAVFQTAVKKSARAKKAVNYADDYVSSGDEGDWLPTSKQIVAAGKNRKAGGSFGPDTAYGKPYEKAQFEILSAIKARAMARTALGLPKYPRQVFSPKNEEEANLRHDAQILFDFPRRIEKGNLPENGRCVKLYNEIEGWKQEMFQMNKAAEEARILQRLLDIKERALQREAEGGEKYPRRIAGTQQDYDANVLKKIPKFEAGLKIWNEIQAWKHENGEKTHLEYRAEGSGPKRKGRGKLVEPEYNKKAREYEQQKRIEKTHSMRLRGQMLTQLPLDTEGAPLPDLFEGALPDSEMPGPSHLPDGLHNLPPMVTPSGSFGEWMDDFPQMEDQSTPRVSSPKSNPRSHFALFILLSSLVCFVFYLRQINTYPHHYDTLATYVEL